jgi:hypothetical protein
MLTEQPTLLDRSRFAAGYCGFEVYLMARVQL